MRKDVLKRGKKLDSSIETCYLTVVPYGNLYNCDYVDIYGIESTFINKIMINKIHNNSKKIFVLTLNSSKLIK